ncbi:MAG: MerR family transcriptional regulator [Schaedlerella sp.]|uniref:MerR family transcriptional regulator n=1 Tax=Schaedlerella sp. TaxID=2676057 RepID=UPI002625FF00|nr:MerR family transcriptional regulator [uncultured Schaedlerella sp.]
MKIKQVEELVGITKKNIRFYEDQGLLEVKRAENGYREYGLNDVKRLQEIRLLRKLAIPIEDMRQMYAGQKSLRSCLEYQVEEMERQKKNLVQVQAFCEGLLNADLSLETLDATQCLEQMERLEKEGTNFMDVRKTDVHKKKIMGAALGGGIMVIFMAAMIGIMIWGCMEDPVPIGFMLFMIGIPAAVIIGVIAALIGRVKEIKGGEEDEASKY